MRHVLFFAGGGKSLSYQLVSQLKAGLTVVVCPLVSLMHDQVCALRKLNITADMLTQHTDAADLNRIMMQMSGEFFWQFFWEKNMIFSVQIPRQPIIFFYMSRRKSWPKVNDS